METFAMWAGAIGAWLLVAGPLLQGTLELWEVARTGPAWPDRKRIDRALWLVLPVMYLVQQRRLRQMGVPDDAEVSTSFTNRATGWFVVAGGALLVAVKETWELTEHYDGSVTTYWIAIIAALLLCQANVTVRMLILTRGDRVRTRR
jgi:uncharacterized membrane protein